MMIHDKDINYFNIDNIIDPDKIKTITKYWKVIVSHKPNLSTI